MWGPNIFTRRLLEAWVLSEFTAPAPHQDISIKFQILDMWLIFKVILMIDDCEIDISCENALRWLAFDLIDEKSTLGQIKYIYIACCLKAC